jgi:hypothetical protein
MILQYAGGQHAILNTTLTAFSANRATIVGTEARLEIDPIFHEQQSFVVISRDGAVVRHEYPRVGWGLRYEAAEVERCLRAGHVESAGMPLAETVQIMETMDEVRRQIGLVYPQER